MPKQQRLKYGLNSFLLATLILTVIGFTSINRVPEQLLERTAADFNAAEKVKDQYYADLEGFVKQLDSLEIALNADEDLDVLKRKLLNAREQFKRTEYLLSYIDNNFTKQINGPTIRRAEGTAATGAIYYEPHGLQIIEENIYGTDPINSSEILDEIATMKRLVGQMLQSKIELRQGQAQSMNAVIWDALRMEIYRIESLGITGYDVPMSLNSIPETIAALESMLGVVQYYEELAEEKEVTKLHKKGKKLLKKAISFCEKNTDFDSFDRITFCRNHLHEIGAWLNDMTQALDVQLDAGIRPFRQEADNMFEEDFFNVNYFLNGYSDEKASLGRKLFFDPILSKGNTRSCATCHDPEMFFSDRVDRNLNMDSTELLKRNTPTLYNAIFQTRQFYDSRVHNLEEQAFAVIHNEQEMAGNLNEIAIKLKEDPDYYEAFKNAYQRAPNPKDISHAVASYVATLTSIDSRFDMYIRKETNSYSKEEKNGFNLFMGKAKCATCHFAPVFNGLVPPQFMETESENIGTPTTFDVPDKLDGDLGKYDFSKLDVHRSFFKTPTVRNSNMSAPMMHNGSFPNIRSVLEFYNNGGGAGQGADNPNQSLPADSLGLTNREIFELITFIRSLEDDTKR
ncbi:MAG: cytochrome-c peroxidase [Crocinitomicaceae bacterium]